MKKKFSVFLRWLLLPVVPVKESVRLRKIKFLAGLLLTFILGPFLYSIVHLLADPGFAKMFYWINGTGVVLVFAYLLNRRGHYLWAAALGLGILSVSILLSTLPAAGAVNPRYLFFILMPVLLGSILLSFRGTLILAGANLAGLLALTAISAGITISTAAAPLVFFIIMSTLILLSMHHHSRLEQERQTGFMQKEKIYRLLVENVNEAIFKMNPDGYFTYISPAAERISRYKAEDIVGKHFSDFIHPDDLSAVEESFRRLFAGVEEVFEFRLVDKDKKILYMCASSRLITENGQPRAVIGAISNLTERKKLEAQLYHAQKMESVGRLAGGAAHAFNNLITVIMDHCRKLSKDIPPEHPGNKQVKKIESAGEKAAVLTQRLLTFSQEQQVKPVLLNINEQVPGLEKMLKRMIRKNITLETYLAPAIQRIRMDPAQLEQVVMNLVVNAADAITKKGTITIETENVYLDDYYCRQYGGIKPGDYVRLTVNDTGCGMDESIKKFLFEPFFSGKDPGKKAGMGLAAVYGTVKQNKGHIWFASEPDKGSTFKIYLPAVTETVEERIVEPGPGSAPDDEGLGAKESLLVVEDEMDLRDMMYQILREYGYKVYTSGSGEEAFDLCRSLVSNENKKIDLLVADVVMPGMNGLELADKLGHFFPGIKVLYISGYTGKKIVTHEILSKGLSFLPKPFSPQELLQKIYEIL
jgi:PAS domain S-box-containing protein